MSASVDVLFREDQVNFRGFMRTLAHFRPIEDNEKNKDPNVEPLNSRTNKLQCESAVAVTVLEASELISEKLVHTSRPDGYAYEFIILLFRGVE